MVERQGHTRRDFLRTAAATCAVVPFAAAAPIVRGADGDLLIIDCHAHIYGEDEQKYPTIEKPYRPPAGTGTVARLKETLNKNGVRHVTAIQTTTYYKFDNRFTVDSARANADFMVGVCTLDPDDAASPARLEKYVNDYNVRGMRSIPAKSGRLDDPGVAALWSAAERLGIVINILADRDKVEEIESLSSRHPKLRLVIDHCFGLRAGDGLQETVAAMRRLAKNPLVHAKLSFIPTGSAEEYPCRDLHGPCKEIIAAFGPERCVWGSDFPCELWCPKVTYAQHLAIFKQELGLSADAKKWILGETAKRLWFA